MNDRLKSAPAAATGGPPSAEPAELALPRGLRLGAFEIERVLARGTSGNIYLATDHALAMPVTLQEYMPSRLARRDAGLQLRASEPWHDDAIARGLRAFVGEARMLAHCDHPALVRVTHLFEALGSAYRVMPVYDGRRLAELRHEMIGAPDEAALRALLEPLLGALEAIHRSGQVHGGVSPTNILLLADDRPLLLGPDAAGHEIGSDLVDSLMATLEVASGTATLGGADAGVLPVGAARDLYALAETLRFCITGEVPAPPGTLRPRETLSDAIAREYAPEARPQYSAALLGTLDAALSPFAEDRPLTAAQFRDWLERGVPGGPIRVAPAPAPAPAPTYAAATPPSDATQPMAARSEPAAGLTGDPITPDRPPWVPPSLPPQLRRAAAPRARRHKLVLAAGVAGLAIVGLAAAAIWWNTTPEIRMEPAAERTVAAPVGTGTALPTSDAAAAVEPSAVAPPPTVPPAATADLERTVAANPPGAGANSSARPVRSAAAALGGSPRAACSGRTEFALYRCMLQQCQTKRWTAHAQCVKLRLDDRVD